MPLALRILVPAALVGLMAPAQAPAAKAAAPVLAADTEPINHRDFRSKVLPVRHRSPALLADILRPLLSGARGAQLAQSDRDGLRTLTVRDFPENLASIEEALKRLDVPGQAAQDSEVQVQVQVLLASKLPGANEGVPEALNGVLAALKGSLAFRSYTLATSFVMRASTGAALTAVSHPDPGAKGATALDYHLSGWFKVSPALEGPAQIAFGAFELAARNRVTGNNLASIRTQLTLKDGETVVVGTTALDDKALIVVLTTHLLKP